MSKQKLSQKNAIVKIGPGSKGVESCDWASMLYRMILRFCEAGGYKVQELTYRPGAECGLEQVTISVSGRGAYGYLKPEAGIHRLVRISPHDTQGRRHTTFVVVEVIPCHIYLPRFAIALCHTPRRYSLYGDQVRSYVLHPYRMAKDHRSNMEVNNGDVDKVMNGHLELLRVGPHGREGE